MPCLRVRAPAALACAFLATLPPRSDMHAQPRPEAEELPAASRAAYVPAVLVPWGTPRVLPHASGEVDLALRSLSGIAEPAPAPDGFGRMFLEGWALIAGVEAALLSVTLLLPSSFSGWEFEGGLVRDGLQHLGEAWSQPPVWDTDHWLHNYVGHPYGGSVYYNTVRVKGATPVQSFLFAGAMSLWWEYALEAMAERPSIQDIVITPVAGALLGEIVHRTTIRMRGNGTSVFEKAFILVFNPTHLLQEGWNRP